MFLGTIRNGVFVYPFARGICELLGSVLGPSRNSKTLRKSIDLLASRGQSEDLPGIKIIMEIC